MKYNCICNCKRLQRDAYSYILLYPIHIHSHTCTTVFWKCTCTVTFFKLLSHNCMLFLITCLQRLAVTCINSTSVAFSKHTHKGTWSWTSEGPGEHQWWTGEPLTVTWWRKQRDKSPNHHVAVKLWHPIQTSWQTGTLVVCIHKFWYCSGHVLNWQMVL